MTRWLRYPRLAVEFARNCLVREMTFRVNFLARLATSVIWLALLVLFFQMIFGNTERIGDWTRHQYLFFMGTGMILNGIIDACFFDNCNEMAEMIRTGDLDHALAKPVDEQFLLTCRKFDWAEVVNIAVGLGLLAASFYWQGSTPSWDRAFGYGVLLLSGVAIFYSLIVTLAASSVWFVRNQALYELWWYVVQFGRYPSEIYARDAVLAVALKFGLTFVLPVLLAVNVPARYGMPDKDLAAPLMMYLVVAAVVALAGSRWFFKRALASYRSASS
jgi:ABC-2 type transport system permease protein